VAKTFTTFGPLFDSIKQTIDEVSDSAKRFAENAAEDGAQLAEELTRSRPSARSGKEGRVETGKMADSFKARVVTSTPERIVTEFGSLDNVEKYFVYQTETGFTFFDGVWVEPTYAMRDVTEYVRAQVSQWVERSGK
jgi:hypothetical protein